MSLVARTVSAVGWSTGAKIVQQAVQFGLSVLLMRLLGPESFGLVAMVLVFSGFAGIFGDMGFSSALVQRQVVTEEHQSTAFWLTAGLGLLISLLLLLASPAIAAFYGEPELQRIAAWIALGFVFTTPGLVPRALLRRQMRFDRLAKIDVLAMTISGGVAAVAAWRGAGVWSLVGQQLTSAAIGSGAALWMVNWRPRGIFSQQALRELAGYGAGLTGFTVINYWARSADNLLVGRFMGTGALGLYSRAYFLMLMPLKQITGVLAPIMLPALSSIQGDKERVRRAYLRATRLITFLAFPAMLGLAVVADPFVRGIYGLGWAEVVPLIQILAIVGVIQTLCNPAGWIYTSQGRTDLMFWWGVGGAGALVVSIAIGIMLGSLETMAWAYLVGNVVITFPCLAIPGRLIGMKVRDVFGVVAGNFACAIGMTAVVWLVGRLLPSSLPPLVALSVLVVVGVVSYGVLAWRARLSALTDLGGLAGQAAGRLPLRVRMAPNSSSV
jgi:O-antigen/teichoic acid export membrane protein